MPDVKAGGAYVEIGAKYDSFKRAAANIQRSLKSIGKGLKSMGKNLTLVGSAIVGPMALAARSFANFGDSITKTAQRLGIGTQELSEYHHVAELSGVSTRTLDMAWQRMTRRISEAAKGLGEAKGALKELNLSAEYLNTLSPDKQFEAITDAMQKIPNQADRVRLAMRLFDSEGVSLVQIMNQGRGAIDAMRAQARELGITLGKDASKGSVELKDNMNLMSSSLQGLKNTIASAIAPAANEFLLRMTGITVAIKNLISANPQLILSLAKIGATLAAVGATMVALGTVFVAAANPMILVVGVLAVELLSILESLGLVDVGVNDALGNMWDGFTILGKSLKQWMEYIQQMFVVGFWMIVEEIHRAFLWVMEKIYNTLAAIENWIQDTLDMLFGIDEETAKQFSDARKNIQTKQISELLAPFQAKLDIARGLSTNAFDQLAALDIRHESENTNKPSFENAFKRLGDIFSSKFRPFAAPNLAAPEFNPSAPQIGGVPHSGVAGFFGGSNAREQLGGVGNIDQRQLNEQISMRRLLQRIAENTDDGGAVYQ